VLISQPPVLDVARGSNWDFNFKRSSGSNLNSSLERFGDVSLQAARYYFSWYLP
jgi:hypothetical protein